MAKISVSTKPVLFFTQYFVFGKIIFNSNPSHVICLPTLNALVAYRCMLLKTKRTLRSVPDEYKPMIFASGEPQPFPSATRKIKRPAPAKRR